MIPSFSGEFGGAIATGFAFGIFAGWQMYSMILGRKIEDLWKIRFHEQEALRVRIEDELAAERKLRQAVRDELAAERAKRERSDSMVTDLRVTVVSLESEIRSIHAGLERRGFITRR